MNGLSLSYLIQKNYLLKKEKKLKFKDLDVMGEHSVLSEATKTGCAGLSSPFPGGVVQVAGPELIQNCRLVRKVIIDFKLAQGCKFNIQKDWHR